MDFSYLCPTRRQQWAHWEAPTNVGCTLSWSSRSALRSANLLAQSPDWTRSGQKNFQLVRQGWAARSQSTDFNHGPVRCPFRSFTVPFFRSGSQRKLPVTNTCFPEVQIDDLVCRSAAVSFSGEKKFQSTQNDTTCLMRWLSYSPYRSRQGQAACTSQADTWANRCTGKAAR